MADTYADSYELMKNRKYESEFSMRMKKGNSGIIYFSPHGGGIESGASELAEFSADPQDSYYAFEGRLGSGNSVLHVTSTHFNEPNAVNLVHQHRIAVSYHGYSDSAVKNTKIGGLDVQLRNFVSEEFTAAGIPWEMEPAGSDIAGAEPGNIVNETTRGMGIQLEISTMQRNAFFSTNTAAGRRTSRLPEFDNYIAAVKRGVAKLVATL